MSRGDTFHPRELFQTLARHGVEYVTVGGVAIQAHGAQRLTRDLDVAIAASNDNLGRLEAALSEVDARILGPDGQRSRSTPSAAMLGSGDQWHLVTDYGRLDVLTLPTHLGSFADMRARAHDVPLGDVTVPIAHRDDLLRMKRASGRPQDLEDVRLLEALGDETARAESLWPRLADLPLVVESCEYERLHAVLAYESQRVTTHVRLAGAGVDGLGEDISIHVEDGSSLHETQLALPLAGEWTLAGFCEHLATLDLWTEPPEWEGARHYRNWAFESAALDLALRQAGRALHDLLGLEPRPVRFVNSLGLGEVPSIEPVRRRLARAPGVRFKLDAEPSWSSALVDEVAATGAVDTIDFKGQYGLEVKDPEALGEMYDRVLAAFPDAYLEDPHDLPEIVRRLGGQVERISYDAPIHSADDIGATPLPGRVVNVKPSRIGSLRALFEVYARCARERRPMYGGGMGELGVGRGQIELLAALFHADAPNDVAPSAYNEDDPTGELPASPLAPRPDAVGFRWAT